MRYFLFVIVFICIFPLFSKDLSEKDSLINQITKIKEQEGRILQNLKKIERDISIYEEKISSSEKVVTNLSDEITNMKISIKKHQSQLKEHKTMYFSALSNFYMRRNSSYLSYVFSTSNSKDFLRRAKYIKFLLEKEQNILDQLKNKLVKIKSEEKSFSERKNEIAYHREKLVFDKKQLAKAKLEKQQILDKIMKKQHELEEKYKNISKGDQKIKKVIKKIDVKPLEVKKPEVEKPKENEIKPPKKPQKLASSSFSRNINFTWPVGDINSVIAFYGKQKNEFNTSYFNTGVNIACPESSTIHASAKGKVMYKGIVDGYGDVLILDHGNGYTTLYANLSDILVGIGEQISQGEDIAKISIDKKLKMGVLHFELRYQGEPMDPLKKL